MTTLSSLKNAGDLKGMSQVDGPDWLTELRSSAAERFVKNGLPTTREEDWLYTDLAEMGNRDLEVVEPDNSAAERLLGQVQVPGLDAHQLVFVNGQFSQQLSIVDQLPEGVILQPFSQAWDKHVDTIRALLGSTLDEETYRFQALNSAMFSDGLFLSIAQEVELERPVHIININAGNAAGSSHFPRILINMAEGARATVVETLTSDGETPFTNGLTEIISARNSNLTRYHLIREADDAASLNTTTAVQKEDSIVNSLTAFLGGAMVRNDMFGLLAEEQISCTMNGLYYLKGTQQVDNFTRIIHRGEDCYSCQVFKGILDDESRGVFDGRILVEQTAQKTDAVQTNRNLLVSDDSVAFAKPQLEIYADDVKCTHAATTGRLDAEQLFYLRSRGFDDRQARALLTRAFAGELLEDIELQPIRDLLESKIEEALA